MSNSSSFNNVRVRQREGCTVFFTQGRVACRVDGTAQTVPLFPAAAAARLLMDKGSGLKVRIVLEGQSQPFLDMQFAKEGDREAFALALKHAKVQVKAEGGAPAAASSSAAASSAPTVGASAAASASSGAGGDAGRPVKLEVPQSITSFFSSASAADGERTAAGGNGDSHLIGHLDALFSGADRRGIASLYTVLDDWVDTAAMAAAGGLSTAPPQLKPLTDQMIADAFAAVPTLAAAHEILVTRRGLSEHAFWVAVVHKYLCFKSTPLDGLVGSAAGSSAQQQKEKGSSSSADGPEEVYLRFINASSARPLRAAAAAAAAAASGSGASGGGTAARSAVGSKRPREAGEEAGGSESNSSPTSSSSSYSLAFAACEQPVEVPARLSFTKLFALPYATNAVSDQAALALAVRRAVITAAPSQSQSGGEGADVEAAMFAPPQPAAKALWVRFWRALDGEDYAAAEGLLAEAASADAGRPHVAQRARTVLEACRRGA